MFDEAEHDVNVLKVSTHGQCVKERAKKKNKKQKNPICKKVLKNEHKQTVHFARFSRQL